MSDVLDTVRSYLGNGGLFNPELMEHEKVRDMVLALRDELERLRQRCNPSKTVAIGDTVHYVSEPVFAEIDRLQRELAFLNEEVTGLIEKKRLVMVELGETNEALAACQSQAAGEIDRLTLVLGALGLENTELQRELAEALAQIDRLEEAATYVKYEQDRD